MLKCFQSQGFIYPPHVGLSIGTALDPQYVLMEVHYDNPSYIEGMFLHLLKCVECLCSLQNHIS